MGEPAHKHGMARPRRSLDLINLVATTTGPIRQDPKPRSTDRSWVVLDSPWSPRRNGFSVRPPLVLGCLTS